ncbi:MAG: Gldg family protein [Bacteroidaceae bacterium]|nr:Gldg family protein [Bacteroidaceae bacterium]
MKHLIYKEITKLFSSTTGVAVLLLWSLLQSLFIWVFQSDYNIPLSGIASVSPLFSLLSLFSLLFIPILTMNSFSEKLHLRKSVIRSYSLKKTFNVVAAKMIAIVFYLSVALVLSLLSVLSLSYMAVAGLDGNAVLNGYIALLLLGTVFTAIGLFTSTITRYSVVAYLVALLLNCGLFYGFAFVATLLPVGELSSAVAGYGLQAHYHLLVNGLFDSRTYIYLVALVFFFMSCSSALLKTVNLLQKGKRIVRSGAILLGLLLLSSMFYLRIDVSGKNRFSISPTTYSLLQQLAAPLHVNLYVDGHLNPSFYPIKHSTLHFLQQMAEHSPHGLSVKLQPITASPQQLEEIKHKAIKEDSPVITPWMEVIYQTDTLQIPLVVANKQQLWSEQIKKAIDQLEYQWDNVIHRFTQKESPRIAFIEGHGEITEPYVFEAMQLLRNNFTIDRGVLPTDPALLYPYKVLLLAGSREPFTEAEKFALDCYVMQGGSLFFLLDGVSYSADYFNGVGESATYKNENNLDDLLFTYGVRVNAELLQDLNCTPIRLATTDQEKAPVYSLLPWYFSPLLQPNASHPITAQLSPVQSEFVSSLSLVEAESIRSSILLTTSTSIHTLPVPEKISLRYVDMPVVASYFNEPAQPVAVLLEGHFHSLFRYQSIPQASLPYASMHQQQSSFARIIVAASSSLIKNRWETVHAESRPIPLGYAPSMQTQLGNASFLVNAVNYLGGNKQLVALRKHKNPLYLLHQKEIILHLRKWQILNTFVPLFLLGILFLMVRWNRKKAVKRYN